MTCARCKLTIRQGMTVTLPDGTSCVLCLTCLREALQDVLAMLAQQTHADLALALVVGGHKALLAQALEAAGLYEEAPS